MANIKLNNNEYSIPDSMLTAPRADFVAHLATIEGDGIRVVVDGVEYNVDPSKVADAVAEIEALLEELNIEIKYTNFTVSKFNRAKVGYTGAAGENLVISEIFQDTDGTWYKVTNIGPNAFEDCTNLTSVSIPNSVTKIQTYAFQGCTQLTGNLVIPDSVTYIGVWAFQYCPKLTGLDLGNGVVTIEKNAFDVCRGLTNVTIGSSVQTIASNAFSDCPKLKDVYYEGTLEQWCNIDIGDYASPCTNGANLYINGVKQTDIVIPDSITSIKQNTFSGCSSLLNVTIPNTITSIGNSAFRGSGLTSVTIPNSVTSISGYAFWGCSKLTDVYYSGTEEQWAAITIDTGNTDLTDATIHYNYQG